MLNEAKEKLLKDIKQGVVCLKDLSEQERCDKEIVLAAVRRNPLCIENAVGKLQEDADVLMLALKEGGVIILELINSWRNKRNLVLKIVKKNGLALHYVSKELMADKEVVLAAVMQTEWAIGFANEEIKEEVLKMRALKGLTVVEGMNYLIEKEHSNNEHQVLNSKIGQILINSSGGKENELKKEEDSTSCSCYFN